MGTGLVGRLEFGVLGPLEVRRDGEPIQLGGERQRALLALLLLHANELVSSERLIEELFAGQRSDAAMNALRVAVSRLRRLLEDGTGGGSVVRTRLGGYELIAAAEQRDAVRFERLLAEGQGLLAHRDYRSALSVLRDALGLWRGAALADVAMLDFVQPEIRRLEELRLVAVMERIEVELALGKAAELIGELESLVAANPLQERLRGQLILALYRAGRQSDALAAYRATSELLRDELGLEPSRALQQLERAILNQDAAIEPTPQAGPAPPISLPVPATPFLGRARELAEVTALLRTEACRLLTLTGAGGSGKTRLALRVTETCAADYRDGGWFVGFADIADPALIAPAICQALGLAEQPALTPIDRLREWLSERELLLVLDNLEQLGDGTTLLGELLANCPALALLVTSREPLHLAGEHQYEVPVLEREDAIELFVNRANAIAPRVSIDVELAGTICERLDRLPLAIELAAARTKILSPAELLERLDQRLPLLTGGPRDAPQRQRTLRATIDWSYDLLDERDQRLFTRLSVFGGGCTLAAAENVCDADLDALQALVDRSLLRRDSDRYVMLQTIREYALERLEQTGEAQEMRGAHARWLIELLDSEGIAPPASPEQASLIRLGHEQANFRGALQWATDTCAIETVARLASPLTAVWITHGQLHEATQWITFVLQHEEKYPKRLAAQVVSAARQLAHYRGRWTEEAALAKRALIRWQELGDPDAVGHEMISVGFASSAAGEDVGGQAALEQAIRFVRENASTDALARGLTALADRAITEGKLTKGRTLCEESLSVSAAGSTAAGVALINLAHVEMLEGHLAKAASLARQALAAALKRNDLPWVAWAAIELAWPLAEQRQLERSGRLLAAGLAFLDSSGAGRDWMVDMWDAAVREILREQLGPDASRALLNDGRHVPLEQAARDALNEPSTATGVHT